MDSSLAPVDPQRPSAGRRWRTPVAVGLAIVVIAAGVVAWRRVSTERADPQATPTPALAAVFTGLPAQLRPPARVPDLPTDRGVGRAALIYHPDLFDAASSTYKRRDVYLVTTSGQHFGVGRTPAGTTTLDLSLSPDGRWLGAKRDGRWRVRDLTGTTEYEVADGYELWLWATDARSVLLGKPRPGGRTFTTMALPGGDVRPFAVRTPELPIEVALVPGRELVVFDQGAALKPSPSRAVDVTVTNALSDATRTLSVVGPGRTRPGEVIGPFVPLWHAGGSPPTVWTEVGRPDLLPSDSPEGSLVAPSVALLGVDVTSGAATTRIELAPDEPRGRELCRGVVADGVVLQRSTKTGTELIVVDPRRATRRVVTTFPGGVMVLVPGSKV